LTADAESGHAQRRDRAWLLRLDADRDNLLAAMLHATAARDRGVPQLAIAVACWRWWVTRGVVGRGRRAGEACARGGHGSAETGCARSTAPASWPREGAFEMAKQRFGTARLAREVGATSDGALEHQPRNLAAYEGDLRRRSGSIMEALATRAARQPPCASVTLQNLASPSRAPETRERGIANASSAPLVDRAPRRRSGAPDLDPAHARPLPARVGLLARAVLLREGSPFPRARDHNAIVECLETAAGPRRGRGDPPRRAL
jgi:hypothetical protein